MGVDVKEGDMCCLCDEFGNVSGELSHVGTQFIDTAVDACHAETSAGAHSAGKAKAQ